jgi:hypothetical protein
MRSLAALVGSKLSWNQPQAAERYYELRAGGTIVATLAWEKAFGSLATAVTSEGSWSFKRVGFLRPVVTVRRPGDADNAAVFQPGWTGEGQLRVGAASYRWHGRGFWRDEWAWLGEAGQELVSFGRDPKLLRKEAHVLVRVASPASDLSLLVPFGFYLMLLSADDAVMAAIVS